MLAPQHAPDYRSDIEGFRAVAILLVVAAHAKVPWLAGGFIGVDVFFVLSGYLITGLLLQELAATGRIRLANFYARRFRRLLPGLALMLVSVSIAAIVLVPAMEQTTQAAAAATAATWISNFYFAFSDLDYFGPNAADNLFLHTWSLGVEEQFYLVWPALLILLTPWGGASANANVERLRVALLVIAGVSLVTCLLLGSRSSQLAFYLMPFRAWQFALGALTLLYFRVPPHDDKTPARDAATASPSAIASSASLGVRWYGWFGITLIVAAAVLLDGNTFYPNLAALAPSVGAAAVLAAGSSAANIGVARALSWRPLQWIGRVSYSWYLWHWPVLLLGGELVDLTKPVQRLELVMLSLALAVLSYRLVDAPIRGNARLIRRPGILVSTSFVLMIVVTGGCYAWYKAVSDWMNQPQQQAQLGASNDLPIIYSMGCDAYFGSADVRPCKFGPQNAEHTVVLMGDSVGAQWFPAVAKMFDNPGWRLLVLTKSACPMVDEPSRLLNRGVSREYVECSSWRKNALKQLAALKPDIVLLGSSAGYDFNQAQWIEGTSRVLEIVSKTSGRIYVLRATPGLPFNGPHCLSARNWLPALAVHQNDCDAPAFSQQNADVYEWLQQVAHRFRNVTILDMNDRICPAGRCDAELDDMVVFRDTRHLTATFVKSLGDELGRRMEAGNQLQ